MKKTYKKITAFIAVLCVCAFQLSAQLSGNYTIDQNSPASATNFISFNALATAFNSNGVAGPVHVDVVANSGPYLEQVQFMHHNSTSAVNKVTIEGNNNLITFTTGWTIGMNGADYFVIKNLQVHATGSTAFALKMWGNANYNVISACTFSVPPNTTSTSQIPVSISGNGTSYTSSGPGANFCVIENCTTYNGYHGIALYGDASQISSAATSFIRGNVITGCTILDFYQGGVWNGNYTHGTIIRKNDISCPNRTNTTTKYGIYNIYNDATVIEDNWIHDLLSPALLTNTSQIFGIYAAYASDSYNYGYSYPSRYPHIVRNNIISDIRNNGINYGIYFYFQDGEVYNNTVSLDHTGATAGTTYGIYTYGTVSYVSRVNNNVVSVTRGGSGTKYAWYAAGGSNIGNTGDRNNLYINSNGGINYVGYYTANALTHGAFITQGIGINQNGWDVDPMFVNLAGQNYHPSNPTINNSASQMGLIFDQKGAVRHVTTPDIGALEFLTPICSGPPTQSVVGPNYLLCPGEGANFTIGNLSSDEGFTYQWRASSVSQFGPWTTFTGANSISYAAPTVTGSTYYGVVITCTAPNGGTITPYFHVNTAGPTSSVVPYFEDFEGIGLPNRLPNCSWSSPNIGGRALTSTSAGSGNRIARSGNSFGVFSNASPGTAHYFTNDIWMDAGVTYSASVWYQTDLTGATNWTDLSILYGTSQSTNNLTQIASTGGPAVSIIYKSLSNTFMVPASGFYNVAIRATSSTGAAAFLSWDDLRIEIPCTPALNTPSVTLSVSQTSICSGSEVILTAGGNANFSWSNGATGTVVADYPNSDRTYVVTGTNTLTGCSASASQYVVVKQSPNLSLFALPPVVCAGKSSNLVGSGADFYVWQGVNGIGGNVNVTPASTTAYTLTGTSSANNCQSRAVVTVSVNAAPTVSASANRPSSCAGDPVTLTGTGASSYQWTSTNSNIFVGNNVIDYPTTTVDYVVTGTDANGCSGTNTMRVVVDVCAGISKNIVAEGIRVFPNPTSSVLNIEMSNRNGGLVQVTDVTGRIIAADNSELEFITVDLREVAAGIYYVKVQGGNATEVIKVIKN